MRVWSPLRRSILLSLAFCSVLKRLFL